MREIRGLLVEDLKQHVELIKSALGFEFGKAWKWTVQWTVCNDLTSARLKIAEPEVYDFAIVDLHLGEGQLQGVPAVEDLVKRSERTFVVAVTGDQAMFAEHGTQGNLALVGALTLYLDFINMFMFLLRIMGGRRSS